MHNYLTRARAFLGILCSCDVRVSRVYVVSGFPLCWQSYFLSFYFHFISSFCLLSIPQEFSSFGFRVFLSFFSGKSISEYLFPFHYFFSIILLAHACPYALLNFPNATTKVFPILFIHLSAYAQFMHFWRFLSVVENSFPQSSQIFSYDGTFIHFSSFVRNHSPLISSVI